MKSQGKKAPDERVSEATHLHDLGDLEGAAQILSQLVLAYPDDLDVRFFFASVLFRLKRFAEAASHFGNVMRYNPLHEWGSLGLFHSLWKSGKQKEAIEEIRRYFNAGGESMEYRRLFKDINKYK